MVVKKRWEKLNWGGCLVMGWRGMDVMWKLREVEGVVKERIGGGWWWVCSWGGWKVMGLKVK